MSACERIGSFATSFWKEGGPVNSFADLSRSLRIRIDRSYDFSHIIRTLIAGTEGEFFLVGGSVRRALFGDENSCDLDIIIPNGDIRAYSALDSLKVAYTYNSNGHRRYRWNATQIDIFEPRCFFDGFPDVDAALRFFDLKINAIGMHVGSGRIIDPFNSVGCSSLREPGINWARWSRMDSYNVCVLAIRLAKTLHELPQLRISRDDRLRLLQEVVPVLRASDWLSVATRFPLGKKTFISEFVSVLERSQEATDV